MSADNLTAIIIAAIPSVVTLITSQRAARNSERHSAKQSILQMILEDQFNWSNSRKLPVNYQNILNEYEIYHKAGGNGVITRKVHEYEEWREGVEKLARDLVKD